jgi:hypothetical protein
MSLQCLLPAARASSRRARSIALCAGAWAVAALFYAALADAASDEAANSFSVSGAIDDALRSSRFSALIRLRYNRIDESNLPERTEGWTVRAIAAWHTRPAEDLRITLEGIHTDHLGTKHFNDDVALISTSPYPLLPDPRTTDLNQAFIDYSGVPFTHIKAGKQILRMGNQRFISDNDFRQIPTVFNGVLASNGYFSNTEMQLGYFQRVRTALGKQGELRLSLFDLSYNPAPGHSIAAYGYFLDQPQSASFTGFADNSHRTLGVRADGAFTSASTSSDALSFPYLIEAARQNDYAGGDARIEANYSRIGGGVVYAKAAVRIDREVKGSNAGEYGLQTPLTDLYAFNGWALQFTTTPRQGLKDTWLTLRYEIAKMTLYGELHRYRSDFGDLDFGRESDLSATYTLRDDSTITLRHARFRPGGGLFGGKDVDKTWLTLTCPF